MHGQFAAARYFPPQDLQSRTSPTAQNPKGCALLAGAAAPTGASAGPPPPSKKGTILTILWIPVKRARP